MMKKALIFTLALVLAAVSLISCAALPEAEAAAEIERLVTLSLPLNEIIYGDSIKQDKSRGGVGNYYYADPSCGYTGISEIKEEIAKVFSSGAAETMYRWAFSGVSDGFGNSAYARFAENENGLLVYKNDAALTTSRSYDFSTIRITQNRGDTVTAEIVSIIGGNPDITVAVKIVRENGVWLLDSPTY